MSLPFVPIKRFFLFVDNETIMFEGLFDLGIMMVFFLANF